MQNSNNKRATTVRQKREIYARRMLMHSAGTHATERKDRQVGGERYPSLCSSFFRAFTFCPPPVCVYGPFPPRLVRRDSSPLLALAYMNSHVAPLTRRNGNSNLFPSRDASLARSVWECTPLTASTARTVII